MYYIAAGLRAVFHGISAPACLLNYILLSSRAPATAIVPGDLPNCHPERSERSLRL